MVLAKKETTVAYKCPHCGTLVMSLVGAFALSADMIKLKCPCGESELTAIYTKDKKVRLTVPCIACPTPHSYNVSSQVFFGGELFRIPCALSGIDICYCGKQDDVIAAAEATDEMLRTLLGDAAMETLRDARGRSISPIRRCVRSLPTWCRISARMAESTATARTANPT